MECACSSADFPQEQSCSKAKTGVSEEQKRSMSSMLPFRFSLFELSLGAPHQFAIDGTCRMTMQEPTICEMPISHDGKRSSARPTDAIDVELVSAR